jgi:hypothetical protein
LPRFCALQGVRALAPRARNDDAVRQRLRAPLIAHELRRLLDAERRRRRHDDVVRCCVASAVR